MCQKVLKKMLRSFLQKKTEDVSSDCIQFCGYRSNFSYRRIRIRKYPEKYAVKDQVIQKCESDKILEKNKITEPSIVNQKSDPDPEGKKMGIWISNTGGSPA